MTIELDLLFERNEAIHSSILDQTSDLYAEIDPLSINAEIKQLIDGYIRPRDTDETRFEKLQDLIYGEDFLNVQYTDERTQTALEAFYAKAGNCLSIMHLYVAMARYVNIEANFQTVDVQPHWDRRGDLLVLSQHINATGKLSVRKRYIVDFTPEIALQQLTSAIVSDQEARSLYFNNLGVEALIANDTEQALKYLKNSLFLSPDSSIAWNNIGTAYSRMGNEPFAEYGYQMAFSADDSNATAINNLAKYYRRTGETRLAREYEIAVERFNEQNPYYHFARGNDAYQTQDWETARRAYRRALRMKEEEPDFYFALARVHAQLGQELQARALLASANELIAKNDEIYQPSDQKVRIIDGASIMRETSPGISIFMPRSRSSRTRN